MSVSGFFGFLTMKAYSLDPSLHKAGVGQGFLKVYICTGSLLETLH